ncbi:hypothetical protein ACFWFF_38525 [Streptomyces sp. NPDC060223]|uniref:hypothetical protein n=1 Tax=unclassified Streptomyces TaxID=2593676 RepID=UPI0036272F47
MNSAGTVQVAVRHILSDTVSGGVIKPRTRTIAWSDGLYQLKRPAKGKHTVELECPNCSASLLAEVRDQTWTRMVGTVNHVLALLCLVLFVSAFAYAVHEGGKTLPEGQSLPTLFTVSIITIAVTFVAGPLFFISRAYNGVSMLDAPKPRRQHKITPVRKARPVTPGAAAGRR